MSDKPNPSSDVLDGSGDGKELLGRQTRQVQEVVKTVDRSQNLSTVDTVRDKQTALQIVLAEYERKQQDFQSSLDTVNHSFNQYLTAMAFLIPGIAYAAVNWSPDKRLLTSLLIGGIAFAIVLITNFTILRMYHGVKQQKQTLHRLKKLHHYLISGYGELIQYLSEPQVQPWLNPLTISQGLGLSLLGSFFAGVSVYSFLLTFNPAHHSTINGIRAGVSVLFGIAAFGLSCWLLYRNRKNLN